jgi:Tat protein secretion system quality control protein TatD with DNase activity
MMHLRTWLLWTLWVGTAWAQQPPLLDAHSHYTAFDTPHFTHAHVVNKLDQAGVSRIVITSSPWQLARELHAHAPQRVIPLLGVYANLAHKSQWMHDDQLPALVESRLAQGPWAGIGELHLFARDAGSPVFAELVRIAATHNLMLLIHGDPEVLDRAFEIAPTVRILWAHLGTVPEPAAVDRVLQRHANKALWVDTSVRDDRIAPAGQLLPEWRQLFLAHPTRFVVAVDTFSAHRWGRYGEVTTQIRQWVAGLPPSVQERLMWRNAEALFAPWLSRHP